MSLAILEARAAQTYPRRVASNAMSPPRFSRRDACAILDIPASTLAEWERDLFPEWGSRGDRPFVLSDLVALAVAREVASRHVDRLNDVAVGMNQFLEAVAAVPDVERSDHLLAVIGTHCGFLWRRTDVAERCRTPGMVIVPLGPLLSDLRDSVFS